MRRVLPRWLPLIAGAGFGWLLLAGDAEAGATGDNNVCTIALSGGQNIWNYVPHIEEHCTADNILQLVITPGELARAESLAAYVCRFDRPIILPTEDVRGGPRSGFCVDRGAARTQNQPQSTR